jgi:hypothetical protein
MREMNHPKINWLAALALGALLLCAGCSDTPVDPAESASTAETTAESSSATDWSTPLNTYDGSLPDGCRQLPPDVTYVSTMKTKDPDDE